MIGFAKEQELYTKVQEHLFEMIPESWKTIYFHTSFIDIPKKIPKGELYAYYIPKGILKRKPVNCYEIPNLFNIDEEEYSRLIMSLYNIIKHIRDSYKNYKKVNFTSIDIICSNKKFQVKYGFKDLLNSKYSQEERHLIWRYEYLKVDLDSLNRNERKVLEYYIQENQISIPIKEEIVETEMFERPTQATIDYESSLTFEEIVARKKEQERLEEKRRKKEEKRRKKRQFDFIDQDDTELIIKNEILRNRDIDN